MASEHLLLSSMPPGLLVHAAGQLFIGHLRLELWEAENVHSNDTMLHCTGIYGKYSS